MAAYFEKSKKGGIAILPMIESKRGVENAEEILSLAGVSGMFVGPVDLRLSLGLPPALDGTEPEFLDALQTFVAVAKKYKKSSGAWALGSRRLVSGRQKAWTSYCRRRMLVL